MDEYLTPARKNRRFCKADRIVCRHEFSCSPDYNLRMGMKTVMLADAQAMRRVRKQILRLFVALGFVLLALTASAAAQKRLILNDGSWQDITRYEVIGNRARYFSSERGEWEEMPRELVDWKATEEWNARPMEPPPDEEEPAHKVDAPDTLTVAPGLRLPTSGGVFMLDTFSGQLSLVELTQDPSMRSHDTASVLHSAINPRVPYKQRFELRGTHARTQAHVSLPPIFVKIDESDQQQQIAPSDRFRILRLESTKDCRILASVDVTITHQESQEQQFVPARVESFGEGWLKITPLGDLKLGEYALVEMLNRTEFNSYAWDFGIDPDAPGNPNSRKADSTTDNETSTSSPLLELRKK